MSTSTSSPDVLVIGAGLTGAMIAARLAEHGAHVGVVDALQVGRGATAHALGIATPDPSAAHFAGTARGVGLLRNIADLHGIKLQSCNTLHTASTAAGLAALRQLAESHPDTHAEWMTQAELLPRGYEAGLLVHDGALVDVERLVTGLLRHPRILVRQNAEVLRLEQAGANTYAIGRDNTFSAACVVLATNAYAGLLSPYLADSVHVVRNTVFTSHPLPSLIAAKYGIPTIVNFGQLAIAPATGGRVNVVSSQPDGGGDETYDALRRFLRQTDPELLAQAARWDSCLTTIHAEGAPLMGRLDTPNRVFYALGLGAFGVAWAPVVADHIAAMALTPVR